MRGRSGLQACHASPAHPTPLDDAAGRSWLTTTGNAFALSPPPTIQIIRTGSSVVELRCGSPWSQSRWHRVACPGQSQAISHTLCTRNTTMSKLASSIRSFVRDEEGATAVEYGLMVALIAAVIVVIVKSVGTKVNTAFTTVDAQMP